MGRARESLASVSHGMLKLTTPSSWPGVFLAVTCQRAETTARHALEAAASILLGARRDVGYTL